MSIVLGRCDAKGALSDRPTSRPERTPDKFLMHASHQVLVGNAVEIRLIRSVIISFLLLALGLLTAASSYAQSQATQRNSFINPFPKGEVYRLHLMGDWFADGMRGALSQQLSDTGQIQVQPNTVQIRSLRRANWDTVVSNISRVNSDNAIDIAVVMFGASEFGSLWSPGKKRIRFAASGWKEQYIKRVDRVMQAIRQTGAAVYWLGMPTLRREDRNDGAQFINEILRERAYINGVRYLDTYTGFADENGNFDRYGPDVTGKIELLRGKDGVSFTSDGYRKLAHFAERAIRRDLRKAKSERKVPLAGSELEQRRINPQGSQQAGRQLEEDTQEAQAPRRAIAKRIDSNTVSAPSPVRPTPGLKDQKADNSVISLRTVENGVTKVEKIEIVRPAIPATVLALLTRKQSTNKPSQIGDNVAAELPGGIMIVSSITSVAGQQGTDRRNLSPTQTPFFRVWAKGESLTPKPGRADDIEWPRPEPAPVVRAKFVPAPAGQPQPIRPRKWTPEGFPPLPEQNPRAGRKY